MSVVFVSPSTLQLDSQVSPGSDGSERVHGARVGVRITQLSRRIPRKVAPAEIGSKRLAARSQPIVKIEQKNM
jgi:hypothetical protein